MCGCVRNGPVTGLSGSYLSHSMWKGCARGLVTHTRVALTHRSPGFFSDVTKPMWSNRIRSIRDTRQSPVAVGVGNPCSVGPAISSFGSSGSVSTDPVGEAEWAAEAERAAADRGPPLRSCGPLTAQPRVGAHNRRLLRLDAPVGDMGGAVEHGPLVGPSQGGASSPIDHDGNRVGEIAVPPTDRAENAVRANPPDVHDSAGRGGLVKLGRRRVSIDGLREGDEPGGKRCVAGCGIRRVEPDKIDAPGTARSNPRKVMRPHVAVDLHRPRPGVGLVTRVGEPNVELVGGDEI